MCCYMSYVLLLLYMCVPGITCVLFKHVYLLMLLFMQLGCCVCIDLCMLLYACVCLMCCCVFVLDVCYVCSCVCLNTPLCMDVVVYVYFECALCVVYGCV